MSGVSLAVTAGGRVRSEALIQAPLAVRPWAERGCWVSAYVLESVEQPPNTSRFPPVDLVRAAGARTGDAPRTDSAFRTGVRIATFRRVAPARCGAIVDERRIEVGDKRVVGLGHTLQSVERPADGSSFCSSIVPPATLKA
jgi:hypothetical protein